MTSFVSYPDPRYLSYVDMLSFIEEVNRCPGGKRTINDILVRTHLPSGAKVLEIGSNTGFTSIEIAKLKDCSVVGIDINERAVAKASELLQREPKFVQDRVRFLSASASEIPFPNDHFDLIVTGGANTFIAEGERVQALAEYRRVLRPYGFVSITNLFYHSPVPKSLLDKLSKTLGFKIRPWTKNYWLDLFVRSGLELYHYEEGTLQDRPTSIVDKYVEEIIAQSPALQAASPDVRQAYQNRWCEIMEVFNENHKYLSFMLVHFRNSPLIEQQELFLERGAIDPWNIDGPKLWNMEE